jgi:hypothetical protein
VHRQVDSVYMLDSLKIQQQMGRKSKRHWRDGRGGLYRLVGSRFLWRGRRSRRVAGLATRYVWLERAIFGMELLWVELIGEVELWSFLWVMVGIESLNPKGLSQRGDKVLMMAGRLCGSDMCSGTACCDRCISNSSRFVS